MYLDSLRVRHKWIKPCTNMQDNDVVIVKDDNSPRNDWKVND